MTRVNNKIVVGFDEPRLNELIKTSEVAEPAVGSVQMPLKEDKS